MTAYSVNNVDHLRRSPFGSSAHSMTSCGVPDASVPAAIRPTPMPGSQGTGISSFKWEITCSRVNDSSTSCAARWPMLRTSNVSPLRCGASQRTLGFGSRPTISACARAASSAAAALRSAADVARSARASASVAACRALPTSRRLRMKVATAIMSERMAIKFAHVELSIPRNLSGTSDTGDER